MCDKRVILRKCGKQELSQVKYLFLLYILLTKLNPALNILAFSVGDSNFLLVSVEYPKVQPSELLKS